MTVTVAVDATGADLGPGEIARGALAASAQRSDLRVVLYGSEKLIAPVIAGAPHVTVVDAPLSIAKHPDPARAVRELPEASIVQTVVSVAEGRADAFVAAGTTGPALAAGMLEIGRADGILRPALAAPIPIPGAPFTLLDVGANVTVRADHLVQFAFMGKAFAQTVLGLERPRVAVLSNGEEATRGTELVRDAHSRLASATGLDFVGNIDAAQLTAGVADVIVTDGFTGNIALKAMEGTSRVMFEAIRVAAMRSARSKTAGFLMKPSLRGLRDELDPELQGGAYLLGLRGLGVIPHGRFSEVGFSHAILRAAVGIERDLLGRTITMLDEAGALRGQRRRSAQAASVSDHDA